MRSNTPYVFALLITLPFDMLVPTMITSLFHSSDKIWKAEQTVWSLPPKIILENQRLTHWSYHLTCLCQQWLFPCFSPVTGYERQSKQFGVYPQRLSLKTKDWHTDHTIWHACVNNDYFLVSAQWQDMKGRANSLEFTPKDYPWKPKIDTLIYQRIYFPSDQFPRRKTETERKKNTQN